MLSFLMIITIMMVDATALAAKGYVQNGCWNGDPNYPVIEYISNNDNFSDRTDPKAFSVRITSKVRDVPIIYCRFSTDSPAKEIFYICLNKR